MPPSEARSQQMLTSSLAAEFAPATNLKQRIGASWVYALPLLDPRRVAVIGNPGPATLRTLQRHATEVSVLPIEGGPALQRAADLVVVTAASRRPGGSRTWDLREVVARDGVVFVELWGFPFAPNLVDLASSLGLHGWATSLLEMTPMLGEVGALTPAGTSELHLELRRRGLDGRMGEGRRWRAVDGAVRSGARLAGLRRYGVILVEDARRLEGPPEYIRNVARSAGIDLTGRRWALSATALVPSRKVLLLVFDDAGGVSEVMKITRDRAFNGRLENEADAIGWLHRAGLAGDGISPGVWCRGAVGDLVAVGETAVSGTLLKGRLAGADGVALTTTASDVLTRLGEATRTEHPVRDAAKALSELHRKLQRLYPLTASETAFLDDQIAKVAALSGAFPSVLQHGDAGSWNAMVRPDGTVTFLDWEAAEADGFPLWDLFYLLRSCAIGLASRSGIRDRDEAFDAAFFETGDLAATVGRVVEDYVRRVGVPAPAVGPLFYTTWLFRMLKQVTRLDVGAPERGKYFRVLRRCIGRAEDLQLPGAGH